MEPIENLNIKRQEAIYHTSKVCNVAISVGFYTSFYDLENRINELSQSFFNQWRFTVEAYAKLYNLFQKLNEYSDHTDSITFSAYDAFAVEHETEFRDYAYLLITGIKTHLDLLACLADIALNQTIREEYNLPDYSNIVNKKYNLPPTLLNEFQKLKDSAAYPWLPLVKEVRDKIIHRGYQLKPSFGFKKSDKLIIQVYKGTDMYTDELKINIGDIFKSFILQMNEIEDAISTCLISEIPTLKNGLSHEATFSVEGLVSTYGYNEIKPL
nr:hypothetical protein [Mucilaginibacter sp. L294]